MSHCTLCKGVVAWLESEFNRTDLPESVTISYEHHRRLTDLNQSAQKSCVLCKMLMSCLTGSQMEARTLYEDEESAKPFLFTYGGADRYFRYQGTAPDCCICLELYLPNSGEPVDPYFNFASGHLDLHPLHTSKLSNLLIYCIESHPKCCLMAKKDYLPRRLIDVGPSDGSRDPVLVEAFELQKDLQPGASLNPKFLNRHSGFVLIEDQMPLTHYVTLSHCWGSTAHPSTTEINLRERKTRIPFSQLNKMFQDAVTVTRYLDVQYLWIDSLCILQDSAEDWERESKDMHLVYNNAVLNIAATSAHNGDDGFLSERIPGCRLPPSQEGFLKNKNLWIRPSSPIEIGPLDRRAWVFQESILAPRTLSIGKHETFFRCREHRYSEKNLQEERYKYRLGTWFIDLTSDYNGEKEEMHLMFARNIYEGVGIPEGLNKAYETWRRVVEVFSTKDLTYDKDKLPAISGIATQFGEATQDRYLAGLWEKDLIPGLLWYACGDFRSQVKKYRGPSWTWVSQSGPVKYLPSKISGTLDDKAFILEANIEHLGESHYGQVQGGYLRLRGKILHGILSGFDDYYKYELSVGKEVIRIEELLLDNSFVPISQTLSCAFLGRWPATEEFRGSAVALLLKKEEKDENMFSRIGLVLITLPSFAWDTAEEGIAVII